MKLVFAPLAVDQLASLHAYIASASFESRADSYIERIVDRCNALRTFPLQGTPRDDLMEGLRTIGFERRATILFTVSKDTIVIEAVYYGGQNFESDFPA